MIDGGAADVAQPRLLLDEDIGVVVVVVLSVVGVCAPDDEATVVVDSPPPLVAMAVVAGDGFPHTAPPLVIVLEFPHPLVPESTFSILVVVDVDSGCSYNDKNSSSSSSSSVDLRCLAEDPTTIAASTKLVAILVDLSSPLPAKWAVADKP